MRARPGTEFRERERLWLGARPLTFLWYAGGRGAVVRFDGESETRVVNRERLTREPRRVAVA